VPFGESERRAHRLDRPRADGEAVRGRRVRDAYRGRDAREDDVRRARRAGAGSERRPRRWST
jgi:hypothetical protein